jgi:hypothetical protein
MDANHQSVMLSEGELVSNLCVSSAFSGMLRHLAGKDKMPSYF